jgi:hypothetical protein
MLVSSSCCNLPISLIVNMVFLPFEISVTDACRQI